MDTHDSYLTELKKNRPNTGRTDINILENKIKRPIDIAETTNYNLFRGLKKDPLRLLKPRTMINFVALKKAH